MAVLTASLNMAIGGYPMERAARSVTIRPKPPHRAVFVCLSAEAIQEINIHNPRRTCTSIGLILHALLAFARLASASASE